MSRRVRFSKVKFFRLGRDCVINVADWKTLQAAYVSLLKTYDGPRERNNQLSLEN